MKVLDGVAVAALAAVASVIAIAAAAASKSDGDGKSGSPPLGRRLPRLPVLRGVRFTRGRGVVVGDMLPLLPPLPDATLRIGEAADPRDSVLEFCRVCLLPPTGRGLPTKAWWLIMLLLLLLFPLLLIELLAEA
jgi:hypothetical protein